MTALGERFASVDPTNTPAYRANAEALVADLRTLDGEFEAGLAQCRSDELVTAHAAFAYLADRYGLSQEGIAGLRPDSEPDAATLRELAAHVAEHGVTTVYSETLVDPCPGRDPRPRDRCHGGRPRPPRRAHRRLRRRGLP